MRIGAISDLHGNKPALDAVFDDMPEVDRVVCAGDVAGYNPWMGACVDRLRERGIPTVMGNHDRAIAVMDGGRFNELAQAAVEYGRRTLNDDQLSWLAGLPDERTLADGRVKLVHGHPDDPNHYTYPEEFAPEMLGDERLLLLGHTHVQHAEQYDEGIVCNPGSVGQPRDGDPRAAYAVIDLDDESIDLRRVDYDIDRVVERIEEVGLPSRLGSRLRVGR